MQGVALGLLHALSAEPRPCAEIGSSAGLRTVCVSLGRHARHAAVQRAGCAALATLAVSEPGGAATCSRIRAEGGVRLARAALRSFSDAEVVRAATAVLRALAAKLVKTGDVPPAPARRPRGATTQAGALKAKGREKPRSPEPTVADDMMDAGIGGVRLVNGKWVFGPVAPP